MTIQEQRTLQSKTRVKIRSLGWRGALSHSPYSSKLAPTDFYSFKSQEQFISGRTFKKKKVENEGDYI